MENKNADVRWKGLDQAVIEAIAENVNRRVAVAQVEQGVEGEPIKIPLGIIEIIAEEAIKFVPAIILWHWQKNILTPDDVRNKRRR